MRGMTFKATKLKSFYRWWDVSLLGSHGFLGCSLIFSYFIFIHWMIVGWFGGVKGRWFYFLIFFPLPSIFFFSTFLFKIIGFEVHNLANIRGKMHNSCLVHENLWTKHSFLSFTYIYLHNFFFHNFFFILNHLEISLIYI